MDTADTKILEEKGGIHHVASSPNNSDTTNETELNQTKTTIQNKDEAQTPMLMAQTMSSNDNATPSRNKEGIGGGTTTLLVNVHNSNENLKISQEPPTSFQLHMSNTPKFLLSSELESDGSVIGISDPTNTKMSSNYKNPPTTGSTISSSIIDNKSSLPQNPDHGDSNKQVGNMGDNSLDTNKSNIVETLKSYSSNISENPSETKTVSELSEKCNPAVGSSKIVRTESSETRDKLLNKTANTAGANADESVNVKPTVSVSNYHPSQSHKCTKSENHHSLSSNVDTKGDLRVRTSIDNSTTNSASSSESFRNTAFDIKTTKSSSHDLAVLEEAIVAKKATAMLPIQTQSVPPKNTPSLLGGSGSLLKTGIGNNSSGSNLVDSLLKHAEARAAKEAYVAAAAAATKKSVIKEDTSKSMDSPSSPNGTEIEKGDMSSYSKTTTESIKGNTNISYQVSIPPLDENVNKLSSNTSQSEMTPINQSSNVTSTTCIKQPYAGEGIVVNSGSSTSSSSYKLNKLTERSSSLQSATSAPHTLTASSSHPIGGKELPLTIKPNSYVDHNTKALSTLTETSIPTSEYIGPKNPSCLEDAPTGSGNTGDDCKRDNTIASITTSTKFLSNTPSSSRCTSKEKTLDTPSNKDGSVPAVGDKVEKGEHTQAISPPTKICSVQLLNHEESNNKKETSPSSLKRELSLPPTISKDTGSPDRKRLKSETAESIALSSSNKAAANLQLTKLSETSKKEELPETKPQLGGSSNPSLKSSPYKGIISGSEDASGKHLFKASNELHRDSVEEAMGKLFGGSGGTPTKCSMGEGVTISPVRSKDLAALITHSSSNITSNSLDVHSGASRLKLLPSSCSGSEKSSSSPIVTSSASIPKSLESKMPSTCTTTAGSSIGSVTITKLSTGSSLNVKSKDLKNILSGSNNGPKPGVGSQGTVESGKSGGLMQQASKNKLTVSKAPGMAHDLSFDNSGFNLENPNVDFVPISSTECSVSNQDNGLKSTFLAMKSLEKHVHGEGDKQTSKVNHTKHQLQNMVFPHLHGNISSDKLSVGGLNSISVNDREQGTSRKGSVLSPNSDSSSSSLSSHSSAAPPRISTDAGASLVHSSANTTCISKSNSKSNSPGRAPSTGGSSIHLSSTSSAANKKSSNISSVSSGSSNSSIPSNKLPSRNNSNDQSSKSIKCKLIRDSKDELHIEGRPKLSIRKVSTPDSGAIITGSSQSNRNSSGGSISIVPERKSSIGGGKPMAKLKLSESSIEGLKPDRDSFSISKNSGICSNTGMPFGKTMHQNKKQHTEDTQMSSVTSVASCKASSSLSIVSGSASSSISRSSTGPSNPSASIKTINFPSHRTHGGKPITMKSGLSSTLKSASSSMGSPVAAGSANKALSASSNTKNISSDFSKSDFSGSKLKIKLSVTSNSSGQEGKNTSSSGSGSNRNGKASSDLVKLENSCPSSYSSVDAKTPLNKSKISDCDNIEQTKKSSSTGTGTVTDLSGDHEAPSGFPSFDFVGKPTYSSSRAEPITSMGATLTSITSNSTVTTVQPTKESPRDASNKDSPASQADSGVFSIASSNSPSKDRDGGSMGSSGSSGTASTSPDSPSRIDRMPTSFVDQPFSNTGGNVGISGSLNPASREGTTNWKPTTTQGDTLTGKQEVPQNPSSSIAFMKSASMSEVSDTAKTSTSNDKTTFSKSGPASEPSSSSSLGTSKCSNVTTSSSQHSFEETSKSNSQSGIRGNHNQSSYQQQRQQVVHQQQMMQQNYTNGPSPSGARATSGAEQPGFHPMYRGGAGTFPNAGGRPPYGPAGPYNQRNADFFGYNSTGPTPSVIDRSTEPPAKRKRGRPRKAGMGGPPGDPTKPAKRSYVRKKKLEHGQIDMGVAPDEGIGSIRQEHSQSTPRVPVAGLPQQQRQGQGGSTFSPSSGGEGRGTNIYNFDDEEFQDDSFGLRGNQPGPLRVGQRKTPTSASQSSGNANNASSNKFGSSSGCSGFGSQDSSDEDPPTSNTVSNSGSSTETSSHMGSQSGVKTSTVMNQQANMNPSFSGMPVGSRSSASLIGAMRQQYSGSNIGLRQPGPMMPGNRGTGSSMVHGVRGGMGGQMNQMHQQRMHAMQAQQQRMQMQSQQQQHMQQHQHMQQQVGLEGNVGAENEETAYSSEIVTKGSGIKLKIKLKKTAEEEAAAKKSRKRKQDDDSGGGSMNTHSSPTVTSSNMAKTNVSSSCDKFTPTSSVHHGPPPSGNICQGSMSSGSATTTTSSSHNVNQSPSSMSGIGPNRAGIMQQHHQGGMTQSQFTGGSTQQQQVQQQQVQQQNQPQLKPEEQKQQMMQSHQLQQQQQQAQYKMAQQQQHQQYDQNRQPTSVQPSSTNIQNQQQMSYQSQQMGSNKQVMASSHQQSGNLQQQSSIRPQPQQMMQQQVAGNCQQLQNSTQNVHNTNQQSCQQALQGRQPQHSPQISQHQQQQNSNQQQQVNKNGPQHPNPHLQRNQGMQQNMNQQLNSQGHGMGMQAGMGGSPMGQHNQMQQRPTFLNMNNTNTNNAVSGMLGSINSPMRSPLGNNIASPSTVTSQSSAQGSINSNQGGQGNSPNSGGMINPFSQQQMLQQRQQQQMMQGANSGSAQSSNSGINNIPSGAEGNVGMGMGPANVQGNVVPSSSTPNSNANMSSVNQGSSTPGIQSNSNVNMMPGMSPNNAGMNIRPGLQGHSYGIPGNMGMNMAPSSQGNMSNMSMGASGNGGQGMAGNVGMTRMPGGMGMNSPFTGGPNQFGHGGGPVETRMSLPYHMQQHQANFYGGAPTQAGHGNFEPRGPGPSAHNPMTNNFIQMQQRQRMMAMQGMQNQFTGPNGPNGIQGQFNGMGNQGETGMGQFGNPMYGGGGAMANNAMGNIGPRGSGPGGVFSPQHQSQMGGFTAQQRMMLSGGQRMTSQSQQLPPHFRGGPGVPQGHAPNSMNNLGMPGNPPGSIGGPRISPSAMHKPMPGVGMAPMPGVGMPKISPQHGNGNNSMSGMGTMQQSPQQQQALSQHNPQLTPRHPTPLVSPQSMQSMHSESVQSPANANPLTPGGNGGPMTPNQPPNSLTPQHYSNVASPSMGHMHNPITPQSHHMMTSPHPSMTSPHPSMTSPHPSMGPSPSPRGPGGEPTHLYSGPSSAIVPSPQQQYHHSNNDDGQQSQQPMMSPAHIGMQMKSPMMHQQMQLPPGTSNLRKIRRQSKPKGEASDDFMGNSGVQFMQQQQQHQQIEGVMGYESFKSEVKEEQHQPSSVPQMTPFKEGTFEHKSEMKFDIKEEIKQEIGESHELKEPQFEAKWDELPNEILNHIFAYCVVNESSNIFLVKAAKVCRQWWHLAMPNKQTKLAESKAGNENTETKSASNGKDLGLDLWTHLDLSVSYLKEKHRNDRKLEWLLRKYPKVLELKLNGWKNAVNTSTLKLIAANKTLVSLSLVGCFKLSNEDLKLIGDTLPSLQRIDLSNVSASSCSSRSAVSSTALSDFISVTGKRLTHFNISNNKMAGLPFVFKALSVQSSNLEELDISNITTTSRDTILINMEKLQKGCPKLRVLNANHTMLSLVETPVKEQVHSPGFPLLRELYVAVDSRGYFDGMDDSQIERILKKSADLRSLDVRGCQHVTESCLIRLPTWDVEKLVVAGCSAVASSDDGLELMVKKWAKTLRELDVSGTSGARTINNAFDAFIDSAPDTAIKKLNICSTSASIKPLTRLLKTCPTIEYLNLQSCRGLPRGMKRLHANKEAVLQLKSDILDGKYNDSGDSD